MAFFQVKDLVKREIDLVLHFNSSAAAADAKVAPLLNKLSDVTFTKCSGDGNNARSSGELITTQVVRKRSRDSAGKQRDWPEKRSKISSNKGDENFVSPVI